MLALPERPLVELFSLRTCMLAPVKKMAHPERSSKDKKGAKP
jgi:hypothetical protein